MILALIILNVRFFHLLLFKVYCLLKDGRLPSCQKQENLLGCEYFWSLLNIINVLQCIEHLLEPEPELLMCNRAALHCRHAE